MNLLIQRDPVAAAINEREKEVVHDNESRPTMTKYEEHRRLEMALDRMVRGEMKMEERNRFAMDLGVRIGKKRIFAPVKKIKKGRLVLGKSRAKKVHLIRPFRPTLKG